jgi:glycosyltransferase involved in cell wall biosynthesis
MQVSPSTNGFAPSIPAPVVLPPPSLPASRETARRLRRVLHVINGEHFSGAERVQQLLGKRLAQFGYDARFACVKPGKFSKLCELRREQVIETPMRSRFDFGVVRQLAARVEADGVELLHAHTTRTALVTSAVSHRTGRPWVYHLHSPAARESTRPFANRINSMIERFSLRNCSLLIAVSQSLSADMRRRGFADEKMVVVANGVPAIEPIEALDRRYRPQWHLGMIALMRPRKGVEIALEAMSQIKQRNAPIQLELIGDFETDVYRQQILHRIRMLGLQDSVHWTGFTNDVPTAIRRLDAMLLPSLFGEGMPMVVLEALSAAVPVIATRVEGTPEVIRDGVEGFLAEPNDAHSLAEKILQLSSDRIAWSAMSQLALQRHRESFSDQRMAAGVAQAYARVLGVDATEPEELRTPAGQSVSIAPFAK